MCLHYIRHQKLCFEKLQKKLGTGISVSKKCAFQAFDATNSFVLPQIPTPKDAPVKRKRKRQLVVDKNNQLSVKEMKKFMKNSRQALCSDPVLVHKVGCV